MSIATVQRSDRILLLIAVCAGLLAFWLVTQNLRASANALEQRYAARYRSERVLVAARDLPAGSKLDSSQVAVRGMPASYLPSGRFPESQFASVLNQQLRVAVKAGDPIESSQLKPTEGQLALRLQPGWRALAMPPDAVGPLGSQLARGDHIDLGLIDPAGSLQWIEDLEVMQGPKDDLVDEASTSEFGSAVPPLSLRVTPAHATRIMEALRAGGVGVVLRSPDDPVTKASIGAQLQRVARRVSVSVHHPDAVALWELDGSQLKRRWLGLPVGEP